MRVAIVSELKKGGVEKVNAILAEFFSKQGVDVEVISIFGNKVLGQLPFKCIFLQQKSKKTCAFAVLKELRKFNPDIILTSSFLDSMIVLPYQLRFKNTNIVYVQHSVYSMIKGKSIKQKLVNEILPKLIGLFGKIQGIVFVSYGVEKDFNKYFKKYSAKTKVIYNPITDGEKYKEKKLNRRSVRIVTAGRLEIEKDHETLIRAVKILHDRNINATLTIYGEGSLKTKLKRLCRELDLDDSVMFCGYVDDLQKKMGEFDIFVLSSLHESFGNVLVEAMSAGLPVISTNCPVGPSEILKNGTFGYLVEMKNQEELSQTIIDVIDNCDEEFIKRAFERSLDFSIKNSVKKYLDFFEILVRKEC